jgi:lysophospholipid acyltransferase (LPLAT)-like uncharacterized protein
VFKIRKPWLVRPIGTIAGNAIRLLIGTVRSRTANTGAEAHPPPRGAPERYIYVLWHEAIVAATAYRIPLTVLASRHADGELMTRVCRQLKFRVIRGSTTRGGSTALLGLIRHTDGTHVALTPDGPTGPRRRFKAGAVALASTTGLPLIPVGCASSNAWRARSWDRLIIPKPYSTAYFVTGPAIHVPPGLDRDGLQRYCRLTEAAMERVRVAAERWAAGGPRPAPHVAPALPAAA